MEEKSVRIADRLDPARAAALMTVIGREGLIPEAGEAVPALFHHVFFWNVPPVGNLAPDGHANLGDLIPDTGLPHRMAAGGKLTVHTPLKFGIAAERTTFLRDIQKKTGSSGQLVFVTLRHEIRQRGVLAISEDQLFVYRKSDPDNGPPTVKERSNIVAAHRQPVTFDPFALFRYSALTMNTHRIHYDVPYAKTEGHSDLLVHGPLLALHLAQMAEDAIGPLKSFHYRARSPLTVNEKAELCYRDNDLWIETVDRRMIMTAQAR